MSATKVILSGAIAVFCGGLGICQSASGAAIAAFDNSAAGNPFAPALVNGAVSVTGGISDPDYNGGVSITLTFSNPVTGVGITDPASPDFASATSSFFGAENSGMGVGNTNLGRFERNEAFTITTDTAITLDSFLFHEWNGDELLNIHWTQNGVAKSDVFAATMAGGTAPATVIVNIDGVQADAHTQIVIANVSPSTANASGRLRIRTVTVSAVPEPGALSVVAIAGLACLRRRRSGAR